MLGDGQHPPGTSPGAPGAGRIEAADQLRVAVAVQHQPVLAPATAGKMALLGWEMVSRAGKNGGNIMGKWWKLELNGGNVLARSGI